MSIWMTNDFQISQTRCQKCEFSAGHCFARILIMSQKSNLDLRPQTLPEQRAAVQNIIAPKMFRYEKDMRHIFFADALNKMQIELTGGFEKYKKYFQRIQAVHKRSTIHRTH